MWKRDHASYLTTQSTVWTLNSLFYKGFTIFQVSNLCFEVSGNRFIQPTTNINAKNNSQETIQKEEVESQRKIAKLEASIVCKTLYV